MDDTLKSGVPRTLRIALFGVLAAVALALVSLFISASSASADDGSGLLGSIGSTVDDVTDTAGKVVDDTAKKAADTTEKVTDKVEKAAPAPVAEVVEKAPAAIVEAVPAPSPSPCSRWCRRFRMPWPT